MGKYADDPAFADIVPLPTDEGGAHPLAAIAYSEEYEETMSYLRAVMAADEKSSRVLTLTADLIDMNPAHYTVWLYRAATLLALREAEELKESKNEGLLQELSWLNHTALAHQKNYQIWHHRTTLIDALDSCEGEQIFMDRMFALDAKNYHVWSYRQWLVRRFDWFDDDAELLFTTRMIRADVRNNSVWNHRWFIINGREGTMVRTGSKSRDGGDDDSSSRGSGVKSDPAVRQREIAFAQDAIRSAPQNESAWNYLRAIYRTCQTPVSELRSFVEGFASLSAPESVQSSHALEVLSEILAEHETSQSQAVEALDLLADRYDPLHANLWTYKKNLLRPIAAIFS